MSLHPRALISIAVAVAVAGALAASPAGASHDGDESCPSPMSATDARRGMTGRGYTVARGRTRESFTVEVLGVLENALGPGRDLIIVQADSASIDDHGVWYGMSGSPVFVGDRLLGAMAFGLAFGPSDIMGVTPADEMYRVLEYPSDGAEPVRRVRLGRTMRHRIAMASGMETDQVAASLTQLRVPVSVSGVPRAGMDRMRRIMAREGLPLIPYAGSAAQARTAVDSTPMRPGDNIGVAASYGDITFAGVGTVTFTCNGRLVSFGHPFLWEGDVAMGANAATTLAVIEDSFGSFELATIDEVVGTTDQDRFAGVRQTLGFEPPRIELTSSIHALNTDRSRDGLTEVMAQEMIPFIGYFHLSSNLLMTMDEYSEGRADLTWTITGTDEDGDPWSLERSNLYSSEWGIADEATFELSNALNAILYNRFEDVRFTGVDVRGTADDRVEQYTIGAVEVSRDGVTYREREQIRAQAGDTIYVRLELQPYDGDARTVDLSVQLPERMRSDASLEIMGGGDTFGEEEICLYDPTQCTGPGGKRLDSFDDLLASLQDKPRNNEIVATLRGGARGRVKAEVTELLDQVVKGAAFVYIRIPGARGGIRPGAPEGEVSSDPPQG